MKCKVAPTKSTTKAYVSFCLSLSAVVSRLSTVFFIDSETKETILLHFRNLFHFSSEKYSLSTKKTFLVECVRSGAASCNKRREFWRETHILLWLLIGLLRLLRYATVSSAFHHCTKKPTKCLKGGVSLPFTGSLRV